MVILCNPGHWSNTDQRATFFLQKFHILINNDKRTLVKIMSGNYTEFAKGISPKIWRCISLGPNICRFNILTIWWNSIPLNWRVETSVSRRVIHDEYTWFFLLQKLPAFKSQIHVLSRGEREFHDTCSLMIEEKVWIYKIPLGLHSPCHPTAYRL